MKNVLDKNLIHKIIKYMAIFLFCSIFLCLMIVDTKVEYNYQNEVKPDNYIILAVLLFVIFLGIAITWILKKKVNNGLEKVIKWIEQREKGIIITLFILLFCIQIFLLQNIFFETDWDLEHIFNAVNQYAEKGDLQDRSYFMEYPYFSIYPNNLFLTAIFANIGRIVLQIFHVQGIYKVCVLLGIILVDLAGIIMVKTVGNFTNKKSLKIISAGIFIAFIGLSPWFLIPYSDAYSILFPISVLYNYTKKDKKLHHYLLIGFCSYFGYLIKPTSIIILIAIVIIEAYKMLWKERKKQQLKLYAKKGIAMVLGIILVMLLKVGIVGTLNYKSDTEYEISLFHYLMMGINKETTGAFSHEDVIQSLSIRHYKDRVAYNKETFVKRWKEMSLSDFANFYTKKLLVNYNDGTLAWGREGAFYHKVQAKDNRLANIFREFYYNNGTLFHWFVAIEQGIWILILILVGASAILKRFDDKVSVTFLALIGLTIFILLFEARARYLYLYSTYYIVLAVLGIGTFLENCKGRKLKGK